MSQLQWKPWHEVVQLRDELNKENFSLSEFAADLYDVVMGTAKPIYQKPYDFFSFTYPTQNLRSLASEIIHRLSGKSDKAIRQLELTYGGGKTHTLITLYHLLNDPENYPDLPTIQEFLQQAGMKPPKTRFGVLPFDKIDVEKGIEAKATDGKTRTLKYPWSILAWQIAGEEGLKLLHGEGKAEERDSAPAEPVLVELFSIPVKQGYSLLILMDEVLMYAHGKVASDSKWLGILKNFFQYMTQAIAKTNNTAMVVSLLSSDIQDTDKLGKEIAKELFSIFRRENEEGIRPVEKEDVAEIIRRRFFKADSIKDITAFYPHVNAALFGMEEFNPEWKKERLVLESTFRNSYPFHPDLIDVFYLKWTNIETFQRTRGILRTFAFALRDSYFRKDNSPLVGSSIFLSNTDHLSNALKELCTVAVKDATEGKQQDWAAILDGELKKAKEIQSKATGVNHRELEQAVITVFLHSQPIGKKASLQDITKMVSVNRPDKIGLRKAMQEWSEISWYLDEDELEDKETNSDGTKGISKSWRLGFKPNLRQLHHDALHRVSAEAIQEEFEERIKKAKRLKANVSDVYKIKLHLLPSKPSDVEDDGDFHFAILNLDSASSSVDISKVAKRFLEENTGADAPRKFKNSVILTLPSMDGVEMIQKSIRSFLAWREIPSMIKNTEIESQQEAKLVMHSRTAEQEVDKAIQAGYSMLATYSNKGIIECFKLAVDENPLIEVILKDSRSRITITLINEETLLPEGPYNLWKEGDESRRVKILIESFAINTHLPKLLRKTELVETLRQGMKKGLFVLKSYAGNKRTYWKEEIPDAELSDPGTELVLNQYAVLNELNLDLLLPSALPNLWNQEKLSVVTMIDYFQGGKVIKVKKEGYEEPFIIPKVEKDILEKVIQKAVLSGKLVYTIQNTSLLEEAIPDGLLQSSGELTIPEHAPNYMQILPETLPSAWKDGKATGQGILYAYNEKNGKSIPWALIQKAIQTAITVKQIRFASESTTPMPCTTSNAQLIRLEKMEATTTKSIEVLEEKKSIPGNASYTAELSISEFIELGDCIGDLQKLCMGKDLKLRASIQFKKEGMDSNTLAEIQKLLQKVSNKFSE